MKQPMYHNYEIMVQKLSTGTFYHDSFFSDNVNKKKIDTVEMDEPMKKWEDLDQCQLYIEALDWMGYAHSEIEGIFFKV